MNDELENVDPEKLTQAQAGTLFQSKVQERTGKTGENLIQAWTATRILNPALYAKLSTRDPEPDVANIQAVGRYGDSAGVIAGAKAPAIPYIAGSGSPRPNLARMLMPKGPLTLPNEGNIEALGLPTDCSFEEFRTADLANAGATPRNSGAIFEALVGLGVQHGLGIEAARESARARFSKLASDAAASGTDANGEEGQASRKAHLASAVAVGKFLNLEAAAAHKAAAEDRTEAGDAEWAGMHRQMADFHKSQADRTV
jgi:hypothetical protein